MDCESVIHLVRAHTELYDPRHPNHRSRDHITHIWRIIAQELGHNVSVEDVKKKWSILRSNYMREKRKLLGLSTESDDSSAKITWPYYDMLTFLDDSMDLWRTQTNAPPVYEYYEAEAVPLEEIAGENTQLVRISNEAIINLVRPYEELYDANHPKHRSRDHIAQIWRIIGGHLKTTGVEAKKKWSNLRSNYNREKRKLNNIYPDGATPRITWPYFERLSFLESSGEWRTMSTDPYQQNYESDSLSVDYPTEAIIIKSENELTLEENENFPPRKRKASHCVGIVDTEGMSLVDEDKMAEPENEDTDFMFLRSLLPMMRMLGPIENLEFKGEVIQLLKRKVQQMPTTSNVHGHY